MIYVMSRRIVKNPYLTQSEARRYLDRVAAQPRPAPPRFFFLGFFLFRSPIFAKCFLSDCVKLCKPNNIIIIISIIIMMI